MPFMPFMGGEIFSMDWNPLLKRDGCRDVGPEDVVEEAALDPPEVWCSMGYLLELVGLPDKMSTIISVSFETDLPWSMSFVCCAPAGVLNFRMADRNPASSDCSGDNISTSVNS